VRRKSRRPRDLRGLLFDETQYEASLIYVHQQLSRHRDDASLKTEAANREVVLYRDVGEGFRQAVKRAGLQAPGKLTLHSLRHGFASLLIANGLNLVCVSCQLGHTNPSITLEVYAHLFDRADHADTARAALDASYTAISDAAG
jgi:integrase